ncbi:MAG TPA: zinc-binding dehydrogenase, partial [Chloroflexota bacterium]
MMSETEARLATAVWFPAARRAELRREPLAAVGPADVAVRTIASAISHGTEMLVYRGQIPPDLPLDLPTLRGGFGFPIKYGYASVGRVEEVGQGVERVREGDLVFVHHPHQDRYVVPASMAVALPAGLDPERGLFTANLETAVNVMLDAGIRLGERVAIFGQGVVGLLLTQLARRAGAGLVVTVDPVAIRRALSKGVGADEALAPDAGLPDEIKRLCGGSGADLAIEASGNSEALQQAIDSVAFQGTVVVCSWYGSKPATLMLG